MESEVSVGGHVLVVEFHTYLYHLIDALPDFDLPRTHNQRKYSLIEREVCEELNVVVHFSDQPLREYAGIKFPKSFTNVLWFYLFGTDSIFFPCYDYHCLSKEGVILRNIVLQTGVHIPHTVMIPELMLNQNLSNITRIEWRSERFNYVIDLLSVNVQRSSPPKNCNKSELKEEIIKPVLTETMVDLTPLCRLSFDQGDLGTCGVSAVVSLLEFALNQKVSTFPKEINTERLSVLFLYWTSRVLIAKVTPEDDAGVELKECIDAINLYGICPESTWPYITTNFLMEPSELAYQQAKLFSVPKLIELHDLDEMKNSLRRIKPFFMDVMFTDESYGNQCMTDGQIPVHPSEKWDPACVHSCFVVGYDDAKEMLIFQNSWSNRWGKNGFGYLPYTYITKKLFQFAHTWED